MKYIVAEYELLEVETSDIILTSGGVENEDGSVDLPED